MMKKIIVSACCLIAIELAKAQAPSFEWAKQTGGTLYDYGYGISVDASANIYTSGSFQGTADFDPGAASYSLTSSGGYDIFISKTNSNGNFIWTKNIGGSSDDKGLSIVADASGNVYTVGYFRGTVDFDPGPGTFNLVSVNDNGFVSKLDANGNFVWAKNTGGNFDYSAALASSGHLYTTGFVSSGGYFISKLDTSGNIMWTKNIGGSVTWGNSVLADMSGNVFTTGYFSGTVDFDPGPGTFNLASTGFADVFISKLDSSGNIMWAKSMGGKLNDFGYSITSDPFGNIYASGRFQDTVDFDPGLNTFYLISPNGANDIFILKLNINGNFQWAKNIGGNGNDEALSVAADNSGNAYTTGEFQGTADFDPGAGVFNLTSSGQDIFILKLDASGNFVWAKNMGGGSSEGRSIIVDASKNVYTTGTFSGTVDFDPDAGAFNLISAGAFDIFVHKMSQCSSPSATITPGGSTAFCSGGNILLNANTGVGLNYQWKLNTVNISGETNSIYSATAAGNYTVLVTNSCGSATSSSTTVTVNSLPSATITPAGPKTFCSGGSVVLNASVAANRTYQWKKGANLISGATLSSYTATTGGNYRVIVTNTVTGCSKTTNSATTVTVNALPAATITPQGPTTFCAGGNVVLAANTGAGLTYKWKKGSSFISGATLSNYTATAGGNYRVQVTNSNGCSKTSALVTVSVPCKEGDAIASVNNLDFTVYPNPNSGEFTIEFANKSSATLQIELTDELGKVVKRTETDQAAILVKESNLAKGIYCLTVRNKNEVVKKKISVVK